VRHAFFDRQFHRFIPLLKFGNIVQPEIKRRCLVAEIVQCDGCIGELSAPGDDGGEGDPPFFWGRIERIPFPVSVGIIQYGF
jgi:hypothetical protein